MRARPRRSSGIASVSVFLLACSSSGSSNEPPVDVGGSDVATFDAVDDTAVAADATDDGTPDADPYGPYPAGPYGTKEGDVLANLDWEGYVNDKADATSTTKPYGPTSLDKLRRAGKGYALVHVSEFN